jgi:hypothetical protein
MYEIKLNKLGKSRSVCWQYFGSLYENEKSVNPDKSFCKLCLEKDNKLHGVISL